MRRALALILVLLPSATAHADAPPRDLAATAWALADVVVNRHIEAPARQQMLLAGVRAVLESARMPSPPGLARRVSSLETPEAFAALLAEVWPESAPPKSEQDRSSRIEGESSGGYGDILLEGMLAVIPGNAALIPAKDVAVNEQVAGNVYVGIQVALGYDERSKTSNIQQVLPGGPADKAGIKVNDSIDAVDDVPTAGMTLRQVIDRLRGAEGTQVAVRVRRKGQDRPIDFSMVRGRLPRKTVEAMPIGQDSIAQIKITEIVGSTPQELKALARKLEAAGARALILDLRGVGTAALHPTVLMADALLEGGTIGRLRTAEGEVTYRAEPDALFREAPMAVVVDDRTSDVAEWLALALEDNHRAIRVGRATIHGDVITTNIPLPGDTWAVRLATGQLERIDGRLMSDKPKADKPMASRSGPFDVAQRLRQMIPSGAKPDPLGDYAAVVLPNRAATGPDPIVEARQILERALKAKTPRVEAN